MTTNTNRSVSGIAALFVLVLMAVPSVAGATTKDQPVVTTLPNNPISSPSTSWSPSGGTFSSPRTGSTIRPITSTCSYCGTYGNNYGNYRGGYTNVNLAFDFSDNDIDQSVDNSITNNVNVNGNNNNVGINNSQETNQNAGISTYRGSSYVHPSRSSYYDMFRRNSSSNGNSNSSGYGDQVNDTYQSNVFTSNVIKKGDKDDDDDDRDNDDLWCELDASDKTVEEGDRITLEWDTEGADDARINQGIGAVDEDGGTERVEIDNDTTFRMTVENDDGDEETCSVTVRVEDDDDNDFSGIVINEEPTINPYSGVYLSDIPYTGLDMGPYAWAYWAAIAGLGAAGAYVFFFMGIPFVLRRATAIGEEVENELADETNENVQQSVMTMPAAVTSNGTAVVSSQSEIETFVEALVDADNDTASEILENATANGASASVFLNRASALLRSGFVKNVDASVIEMLVGSLETAAKARA